jgi:hypothetical protein
MENGPTNIPIGDGTLLMALPPGFDSEIQDDGTVFVAWSELRELLLLRFSVMTIGAKPPAKAADLDMSADVVEGAKEKGHVAIQSGDKAWYCKDSESEHNGQLIWMRFWHVGFKNRMIVVSLTCSSRDKVHDLVHRTLDLMPDIIDGLRVRAETSPLTEQESAFLESQRNLVRDKLRTKYGVYSLPSIKADLPVLQQLLNDRVFSPEQEHEWSSVGVVFGDIVANELGLRWVAHCDEYGAEPALNLDGTSIKLFPRPMILKRIEKRETMDLKHQLEQLGTLVSRLKRDGY